MTTESNTNPKMVEIPAGDFLMGVSSLQNAYTLEEVAVPTHVNAFRMDERPVSRALWAEVMGEVPPAVGGDEPKDLVSFIDAVEFCIKRSVREGLRPCYIIVREGATAHVYTDESAPGYRLPTEAEWEYAAKAGVSGPLPEAAYSPENVKRANPWGLYGMFTSFFEWTGSLWKLPARIEGHEGPSVMPKTGADWDAHLKG
jgi:formylglycine-generating enzyme required for sulfatase activity